MTPGGAAPGVPRRRCRRWPACRSRCSRTPRSPASSASPRRPPRCAASPTTTRPSGSGIFIMFALGYIVLVEAVSSFAATGSSAAGGRPMSRQRPLRRPRPADHRPAPDLHRRRRSSRWSASLACVVWRLYDEGQFEYDKWEPFVTPELHRGAPRRRPARHPARWPSPPIIGAVVFGFVFGVGKLSDHGWMRWPCWAGRGVLPRGPGAAADGLHLLRARHRRRTPAASYWARRHRAHPLQRRGAGRGVPRRHQRRARAARRRRRTPSACARPR